MTGTRKLGALEPGVDQAFIVFITVALDELYHEPARSNGLEDLRAKLARNILSITVSCLIKCSYKVVTRRE